MTWKNISSSMRGRPNSPQPKSNKAIKDHAGLQFILVLTQASKQVNIRQIHSSVLFILFSNLRQFSLPPAVLLHSLAS